MTGGLQGWFHKLSIEGKPVVGRVSVTMATEPAPCDLDVYLNARELRDVIFTPVFSPSFSLSPRPENALGDNVILSTPSLVPRKALPETPRLVSRPLRTLAVPLKDNVFFGKQR